MLARLARALTRQDLDAPLAHRWGAAVSVVAGSDSAAITLFYTGVERITVCATSDLAARIEDLQDVLEQGPGAVAYDTGFQVRVGIGLDSSESALDGTGQSDQGAEMRRSGTALVADGERRWPLLVEQVTADFGAVGVLAVPIRPGLEVLGVLTFYTERGSAPGIDSHVAQILADAVGNALLSDPQRLVNESSVQWASRAVVHQAAGVLIAQLRISSADALALLRARASTQGISLFQVCKAVVRHEIDFTAEGDPPDTFAGPA